tara:strand:- start:2297 stop:3607 length:1311 start_codon:yes stop_codon:yes gene_type:complete
MATNNTSEFSAEDVLAKAMEDNEWMKKAEPDRCSFCCDIVGGGTDCVKKCDNMELQGGDPTDLDSLENRMNKCFDCFDANITTVPVPTNTCRYDLDYMAKCFKGGCEDKDGWDHANKHRVEQCYKTQLEFTKCFKKRLKESPMFRAQCEKMGELCNPTPFMGLSFIAKNKGDFGKKELREGFGLVWDSKRKEWVKEGTMDKNLVRGLLGDSLLGGNETDSFGTVHETHYHQCLSRAKQADKSGFFHPCKPLGGTHTEDYKFPFLPLLKIQGPMLGASFAVGKYTTMGLAGGSREGPIALIEMLLDAGLNWKADKHDSTRKAENAQAFQDLNDEIANHRTAMMNKIRKGKITKAEMEMTVKRIEALEKERRKYDKAVFDLISEFKNDPMFLKIKTKFEKDTSGTTKKERAKVKVVTMIAISAVVILIFRLLWALFRR